MVVKRKAMQWEIYMRDTAVHFKMEKGSLEEILIPKKMFTRVSKQFIPLRISISESKSFGAGVNCESISGAGAIACCSMRSSVVRSV